MEERRQNRSTDGKKKMQHVVSYCRDAARRKVPAPVNRRASRAGSIRVTRTIIRLPASLSKDLRNGDWTLEFFHSASAIDA